MSALTWQRKEWCHDEKDAFESLKRRGYHDLDTVVDILFP